MDKRGQESTHLGACMTEIKEENISTSFIFIFIIFIKNFTIIENKPYAILV